MRSILYSIVGADILSSEKTDCSTSRNLRCLFLFGRIRCNFFTSQLQFCTVRTRLFVYMRRRYLGIIYSDIFPLHYASIVDDILFDIRYDNCDLSFDCMRDIVESFASRIFDSTGELQIRVSWKTVVEKLIDRLEYVHIIFLYTRRC